MQNENYLFNSLNHPIPEIRRDLQIIPVREQGRELLFFYDSLGYIPPNFALDASVKPLLSLFSGSLSLEDITRRINGDLGKEELLGFVQLLDENLILDSDQFHRFSNKIESDFEKSEIRIPALSGMSYPANQSEMKNFLGDFNQSTAISKKNIRALYAPHIDIRVGNKQYIEAFTSIKDIKPSKVVILATAHYAGNYKNVYSGFPFIGSTKKFQIADRDFEPDYSFVNSLAENSPENGFTLQDRAHRVEHSIEIHLLYVSQIWRHNFKIIPILVGGIDELFYYHDGELGNIIEQFTSQLKNLIDDETFILISGDLSHVGRKFGDEKPASELRNQVEKSDQKFLEISLKGNSEEMLSHVAMDYDSTRICGFSPLYTFLKTFPDAKGKLINYHWWDEKERESAVSFASIVY